MSGERERDGGDGDGGKKRYGRKKKNQRDVVN